MPVQLKTLLSQIKQGNKSCRQVSRSSDGVNLSSLSPEALKTQYRAYGLLKPWQYLLQGYMDSVTKLCWAKGGSGWRMGQHHRQIMRGGP